MQHNNTKTTTRWLAALVAVFLCAQVARAVDIEGILPATASNPQVHGLLEPAGGGPPYENEFLGFDVLGFLDTGSTGVVISELTAQLLNLPRDPGVDFADVAIGGATHFDVSQAIRIRLNGTNDPDYGNPATQQTVYNQAFGPMRVQIGPQTADDDSIFDVYGMPVMAGKNVVIDPRQTVPLLLGAPAYIYDPNTPFNPATELTNPGVPQTNHHVQLSYGDFSRFTQTTGPGAPPPEPPALAHNPFLGPNPVSQIDPNAPVGSGPPLSLAFAGHQTTGSFLLDTGGSSTFISAAMAEKLNVKFVDGTQGTDNPLLETLDGGDVPGQFILQLQGLGGVVTWAGFYLDQMVLQTIEGSANLADPNNIRYLHLPVLVSDFSVRDPITGDEIVLDGVFGMNTLLDSLVLDGLDITDLRDSPYKWIVFDEPNGILGLDIEVVPEPSSYVMATSALFVLAGYAWRRRHRAKTAIR